ncbi:HdeD family acid-resistance protein [Waddlia chondrophila]|uniref:Acid-resistance membrane protein n=1 Tax=Waddlia chondrophila (strain ATCC VR-1470 / WSU 86-1044) TaxID=716544 RepID=D6YU37_WADCW|nr:DUF308 domain-containing protein [Waddlia chondrophila]ADI37648.1 conserved hypothetical protein [Waddlia chondrophila WSU 86-1044]
MSENQWFLIFFEGVILVILGIFAIFQPFLMTLSVEFFLGVLLIAAGLAQIIRGVANRSGFALIGGILALVAGGGLLSYPVSGVLTLTFLMIFFLTLDGIVKIVNSLQFRSLAKGWEWLLFSGVLSLILAGLIYSGWPTTAGWVIGLYVGIYLLFLGMSLVVLSFSLKKHS